MRDENSQAGIVITCVAFCVHEQSIILIIVTLSMNNHDYYLKLFMLTSERKSIGNLSALEFETKGWITTAKS